MREGGRPRYFHTRLINKNGLTVSAAKLGQIYSSLSCYVKNKCVSKGEAEWKAAGWMVCGIFLTVSVYESGCKDDGGPGRSHDL